MGLFVGMPVIGEFIKTAYITKVPSAILAAAIVINSFLLFAVGIIMDSIKNSKQFITTLFINRIAKK